MTEQKYRVFKRSARNWDEFASASKRTVRKGLSYAEAQRMCSEFNGNRTRAQEARGTKYEFEAQ